MKFTISHLFSYEGRQLGIRHRLTVDGRLRRDSTVVLRPVQRYTPPMLYERRIVWALPLMRPTGIQRVDEHIGYNLFGLDVVGHVALKKGKS